MVWWTEERKAEAKRRWDAGESATEIAKAMNAASRNAVLGVLTRMGVKRNDGGQSAALGKLNTAVHRTRPTRAVAAPAKIAAPRAAAPPSPPRLDAQRAALTVVESSAARRRAPVANPDGGCKWPIGDPGSPGFGFCGDAADGPYCAAHKAQAYAGGAKGQELYRSVRRYA